MVHRIWVIGVVLVFFAGFSGVAMADGGFIPQFKSAMLAEPLQRAIILHQDGVEDLAIQVKYSGDAQDFCWIVPVPAVPKVQTISANVFDELSGYTLRRMPQRWVYRRYGNGGMGGGGGEERESRSIVEVVDRTKVGIFDTAVIKGEDPGEIQKWLVKNGYEFPASRNDMIEFYTKKGWVFVAMRIDPADLKANMTRRAGTLAPVMLTFESKEIVYPLYVSSLNEGATSLVIHVIADMPVRHPWCVVDGPSPTFVDTAKAVEEWKGKEFYRRVSENEVPATRAAFYRMKKDKWFVTRLECMMNAELMVDDLVFKPAGDDEEDAEIAAYLARLRILAQFRLENRIRTMEMPSWTGDWVREWQKTHVQVYSWTTGYYDVLGATRRGVGVYFANPIDVRSDDVGNLNDKERKAMRMSLVSLHRQAAREYARYNATDRRNYCVNLSKQAMELLCKLLERNTPEYRDWESYEKEWQEVEEIVLKNAGAK